MVLVICVIEGSDIDRTTTVASSSSLACRMDVSGSDDGYKVRTRIETTDHADAVFRRKHKREENHRRRRVEDGHHAVEVRERGLRRDKCEIVSSTGHNGFKDYDTAIMLQLFC